MSRIGPSLRFLGICGVALALAVGGVAEAKVRKDAAKKAKKGAEATEETTPAPEEPKNGNGDGIPEGFIPMTVMGVLPSDGGGTVFLTDEAESVMLPIGVGSTEALSILLRLDRRRYERPLTHDLFDSMMSELGGELVQVRVDDLLDHVYVATIYVQQGDRTVKMDSRASDAIALALGAQLPIYFSAEVVAEGSIPWTDLLQPPVEAPPPGEETTPPVEETPESVTPALLPDPEKAA